MKYLRRFNESNWFENITENIEDILLELNDIGYKTHVDVIANLPYPRTIGKTKYIIRVEISRYGLDENETTENINIVKDVLLRIKSFMSDYRDYKIDDDFDTKISVLDMGIIFDETTITFTREY